MRLCFLQLFFFLLFFVGTAQAWTTQDTMEYLDGASFQTFGGFDYVAHIPERDSEPVLVTSKFHVNAAGFLILQNTYHITIFLNGQTVAYDWQDQPLTCFVDEDEVIVGGGHWFVLTRGNRFVRVGWGTSAQELRLIGD